MGKNQVARTMRRLGLRAKTHKSFRVKTTDSNHSLPIAENLLNRQFKVSEPNKVLVSDVTYVWTNRGWAYLTVFIDLFSRSVVGWNVSDNLSADAVLTALNRAIKNRNLKQGTIIHSDRGSQYAAAVFRKTLQKHGFIQSMSRKGNCWDNAVAESFFRIYKTEMAYHCKFIDAEDLKNKTFEYIECYYNRKRLHSNNNFLTPAQREDYFYKGIL
jgi:putative transposase